MMACHCLKLLWHAGVFVWVLGLEVCLQVLFCCCGPHRPEQECPHCALGLGQQGPAVIRRKRIDVI